MQGVAPNPMTGQVPTLRDTYNSQLKRGQRLPAGVELEPPLPEALAYLMEWFDELSRARTSSGFGLNPITYMEMDAWARLTDRRITPFDAKMLKDIDTMWLLAYATTRAAAKGAAHA